MTEPPSDIQALRPAPEEGSAVPAEGEPARYPALGGDAGGCQHGGGRGRAGQAEARSGQHTREGPGSGADGPGSGGGLDSYRVTHERPPQHVAEAVQKEPDCPYPIEVAVDHWDTGTGELVDAGIRLLPCGRKGCPVCGQKVRDRYVAHFSRVFADLSEDRPVWFLTLTVDPKVVPDDATGTEARKYLTHCWDKYAKRLRYRAEDLKYAGAFEQHQDGRYHLHVLVAADFPGVGNERDVREMMRVQWFQAGGGAVGDVKRIREGRTEPSEDGRPDGVAGACGYVVKYAFKDAADAHREAVSRRSLIASQGIGYHSQEAKERRREHAQEDGAGGPEGIETEYSGLVRPTAADLGDDRGRQDTITPEDRARFEQWDRSARTVEYVERVENSRFEGRDVWIRWRMEADVGELRRTVYDSHPSSSGAAVIESEQEASHYHP